MSPSLQNYKLYNFQAYCFKRYSHLISQIHLIFQKHLQRVLLEFFVNCNNTLYSYTLILTTYQPGLYYT